MTPTQHKEEALCLWCRKTYADHADESMGYVPRVPCIGLKRNFVEAKNGKKYNSLPDHKTEVLKEFDEIKVSRFIHHCEVGDVTGVREEYFDEFQEKAKSFLSTALDKAYEEGKKDRIRTVEGKPLLHCEYHVACARCESIVLQSERERILEAVEGLRDSRSEKKGPMPLEQALEKRQAIGHNSALDQVKKIVKPVEGSYIEATHSPAHE